MDNRIGKYGTRGGRPYVELVFPKTEYKINKLDIRHAAGYQISIRAEKYIHCNKNTALG
jgi:hypothetical protein